MTYTIGQKKFKHKLSDKRIYKIYYAMLQRCNNPNCQGYKNYGGRGIKVCDEWLGENGVLNFNEWAINNGYSDNLSIDRIDVNGNYEPSNCRWADENTQANNTTRTIKITIGDDTLSAKQWACKKEINPKTLLHRIHKGVPVDELFNEVRKPRFFMYNNRVYPLKDAEKILDINFNTVQTAYTNWKREHLNENVMPINENTFSKIPHKKMVIRIDKNGNETIYESISEASRQNGIASTNISKCCLGLRKQAGGFLWKQILTS